MTRYVLGFAFNSKTWSVYLISKKRGPSGVINRWNGLGGKIRPEETPLDAMVREFQEEGGVSTERDQWLSFGTIGKPSVWECELFCTQLKSGQVPFTTTDETVAAWDETPRDTGAEGLCTLVELARYRLVTPFSAQMVYP